MATTTSLVQNGHSRIPCLISSAVRSMRTYSDQTTQVMAMTWNVTEHMIFLRSLAVIWSFSHLRRGLSLVSIMNSYLQSSQQRVSELLIHCCRQDWCTKRRLPVQWQGVISGLSSSPSQWQILQMSWLDGETDVREKLHGALTEVGLPAFDILLDLLAEWPRGFSFWIFIFQQEFMTGSWSPAVTPTHTTHSPPTQTMDPPGKLTCPFVRRSPGREERARVQTEDR